MIFFLRLHVQKKYKPKLQNYDWYYYFLIIRCSSWLVGWQHYARRRFRPALEHHHRYHRRFHRQLCDEPAGYQHGWQHRLADHCRRHRRLPALVGDFPPQEKIDPVPKQKDRERNPEGFRFFLPADTVANILVVKACTRLFVRYIHLRRKKCTFIEETKMIRLIEANCSLQTVQSRVLRQYLKMLKTANNNCRMCFVFVCQFIY